ncbi:MAG: flagellar biosynthesis protein FlhB [Proteobacteria bacterium]|nr:flagellar biosynthesis protein FlhB [Pseudomonadota bacterium]
MPEDSFGEKTEDATPRKLEKAREEGQVGKSIEVPAVFVVLAGVFVINLFAVYMYKHIAAIMQASFVFNSIPLIDIRYCMSLMYHLQKEFMKIVAPVFGALLLTGLAANFMQVGFILSWKALEPKLSRIDPIKGFKNKFSSRALAELVKSIFKIFVIALVAYYTIKSEMDEILRLYDHSIGFILIYILKISFWIFIRVLLVMMIMAFFDLAFQKWKFAQDQMMSRQEVKDDMKQAEGDPAVKAKIRQIQMEAARKRMMAEVPKADVVVTNPTHLALAIRYDSKTMTAPMVTAKGSGMVAERIRKVAYEAGVPIVENKELARSLFKIADVGDDVPSDLYRAVAELLAYVYKLKGKTM